MIFQVIFQIALTILDLKREELENAKDDGEAMTILSSYLENVSNRDSTMPNVQHTSMLCSTKSDTVGCLLGRLFTMGDRT